MSQADSIDARTIELIATRVAQALREELEAIAAALTNTNGTRTPLTVDDVAKRFGVARSTVYAHWREWGGYKLGDSDKAAIRFSPQSLPEPQGGAGSSSRAAWPRVIRHGRRRHSNVLPSSEPRLPDVFDEPSAASTRRHYE
jgi:transposase-like protein